MLHACIARFNVIGNLKIFYKLNKSGPCLCGRRVLHHVENSAITRIAITGTNPAERACQLCQVFQRILRCALLLHYIHING